MPTTPSVKPEFDFKEAVRKVLIQQGFLPTELDSPAALKFIETAEFQQQLGKLHKEFNAPPSTPPEPHSPPPPEKPAPTPSLFQIKDMQNADFDLSKFTKADVLKVFNDHAKTIRQKYETKLKTTTAKFEKDHEASQKVQQDYEQLTSVIQNLPDFLSQKFGKEQVSPQLINEIKDFAITTAAAKVGKTVSQYYQDMQKELADQQAAQQQVVANVDQGVEKFLAENALFKDLPVDDKTTLLKNALIAQKFQPDQSIEPVARALFIEEYDELIKQQAIAGVLAKDTPPPLDAITATPNVIATDQVDPETAEFERDWKLEKARETSGIT